LVEFQNFVLLMHLQQMFDSVVTRSGILIDSVNPAIGYPEYWKMAKLLKNTRKRREGEGGKGERRKGMGGGTYRCLHTIPPHQHTHNTSLLSHS
jgi:hypothetical protein